MSALPEDQPIHGMPDIPAAEPLWAVHVQGPDDVIPVAGRADGDTQAAAINDWYEKRSKEPDFDPRVFPRIRATVVPWPYGRHAHAAALADEELRTG